MTIAIALKINDGIVLATDSASAIIGENEGGFSEVVHTYFTADKLFNLKKKSPIGAMTWGHGSINYESISTLVKDFRKDDEDEDYVSVKDTSFKFKKFLEPKLTPSTSLGFLIAGYSENESHPEMFLINVEEGQIKDPIEINADNPLAITWFGQQFFLRRYLLGYDDNLKEILTNYVDEDLSDKIIDECDEKLQLPLGVPAMPIQDAIDLVKFLANISVNSSKFFPGPQVIGGPIDVAVITKHEGFKWIERKHYYENSLNLTTGGNGL